MSKPRDLLDPALYINRELSQLEFNFRVLAQAMDERIPLLDRLRYLCISCTNLDEFFEIRVAAVRHQLDYGGPLPPDAIPPATALKAIHEKAGELVRRQYQYWNDTLRPALSSAGVRILTRESWNAKQKRWLKKYFDDEILPVLSPLGLDPVHPFPRILNKSLNIVVVLQGKDAFGRAGNMAIVRAPRSLPRIIHLPPEISGGAHDFVLLSAVLSSFVDDLFPGMEVKGAYQFRVTRNSELLVDEEEVENLAHALKGELAGRGFARAMRLEIAENCPKPIVRMLLKNFELPENAVYRINGPVNLNRVIAVYDLVDRPELKFPAFKPRQHPKIDGDELFDTIRRGDVLLHHPYDSFASVIELVKQAAQDPSVLAIKQTLYRAGKDSVLVNHLIEAARNGKDVTVVIELRARFDEEANIRLADRLQEAGVQVVYGVVGYKTHAKMLLIVRREGRKLQRYAHLSTGNYHAGTARAYTDIGLMTADADIGEDVHRLFQQMSGLAPAYKLKRVLQSPFTLHKALLRKIEREATHAREGKPAKIIAKMNALNEAGVIRALYEASRAGVQIELIVRGACALRPGVAGVSDHIRVRSLVGRFLEHSRVYWFQNDAAPEIWCSSADWMERNLLRRIETCFPILDPALAERVYSEELANYLSDNVQAWQLMSDGSYRHIEPEPGTMPHSAQDALLAKLCH
ncbi:MAG: polyphosphate kinase 1 [Chiayiivirga sp.]|jgi:polyphosphate kinase|uniref:polyphosphate kinase 1 n=1 Tax=Chiayiivirga sp. TaxID=2041042 RepID=UPI0025BEF373|nr:polyphosphate kinase 1 [Chiayiivirga sp.]MCI1729021.1 polyphosphate kinase 1 [Chiayiivirga sp.]